MNDIWAKFDIAAGAKELEWLEDENQELANGLRFAVMNGEVTPETAKKHALNLYGETRVGLVNRVRLATLYLCHEKRGKSE